MKPQNHTPETVLTSYKVNYLYGLPDNSKNKRSIQMHLTGDGFLFEKHKFNLYIDYGRVKKFETIKGTGSFWNSSLIADYFIAKLFEITYLNDYNQQICVRFEMNVSSFSFKNANACEDLVRFMKNNGIFDKFIPSSPASTSSASSSSDILTQIERLSALHKSGALTDEEFQSKKADLLKRL